MQTIDTGETCARQSWNVTWSAIRSDTCGWR